MSDSSKNKRKIVLITACYLAALMLVLIPFVLTRYNSAVMEEKAAAYTKNISEIDNDELAEAYERAEAYNAGLKTANALFDDLTNEEAYESCLNLSGDGMMGTLEIPSIDVNLPIYHYVTDDVLKRGIGHIETSALPVGGAGTRCILSGHRGLPGSRLLTYLDEVEIGDLFYLHVLDETLAYEVVEIEVVLPDEVETLATEKGRDLCTIVTCTPYGVNSHRLLVTGERTEYVEKKESEAETKTVFRWQDYVLLLAAAGESLVYICLLARNSQKKRRHNQHGS